LSLEDFNRQVSAGLLSVIEEQRDKEGHLKRVTIESVRYIESDTALVTRVLSQDFGGKQNILVMNDEAHHAYRIQRDEPDVDEEDEIGEEVEAEEFMKEATVWVEGLDRIDKNRGINFCVDLSATRDGCRSRANDGGRVSVFGGQVRGSAFCPLKAAEDSASAR
jgi:type III restriction enzyme